MEEEVGKYILTGIICSIAIATLHHILVLLITTLGAFFIPVYLVAYMVGKLLISRHKIAQKAAIVDREEYVYLQHSSTNYEDSFSPSGDRYLPIDYGSSCDFDISWDEINDLYPDSSPSYGIGDPTCIYNAHSTLIRCAVNPDVECGDCRHYERST
jgi:Family of unknown function (DUF6464)